MDTHRRSAIGEVVINFLKLFYSTRYQDALKDCSVILTYSNGGSHAIYTLRHDFPKAEDLVEGITPDTAPTIHGRWLAPCAPDVPIHARTWAEKGGDVPWEPEVMRPSFKSYPERAGWLNLEELNAGPLKQLLVGKYGWTLSSAGFGPDPLGRVTAGDILETTFYELPLDSFHPVIFAEYRALGGMRDYDEFCEALDIFYTYTNDAFVSGGRGYSVYGPGGMHVFIKDREDAMAKFAAHYCHGYGDADTILAAVGVHTYT